MGRVILHSDLNNCYASIELLHRPELRATPFAVGGDMETRHGIILSKNNLAKKAGVKTGEVIWQARQKCPTLVTVPPNFDLYWRFCSKVRAMYSRYTGLVQPFGMDECWLDLSGTESLYGPPAAVADGIRRSIKQELGLTVSIGVSFNKIFAKLGSDYKKPDATTVISKDNFRDIVWPLPAADLLYVGPATEKKLRMYGIATIGDIARANPDSLKNILGVMGLTLHGFANGRDLSPVVPAGEEAAVKSIGNSITAPRDILTKEDAKIVVWGLAESVAARLRRGGLLASCVAVSLRDTSLSSYERQKKIDPPTDQASELCRAAMQLISASHRWGTPIRSLGIRSSELSGANQAAIQQSLFLDDASREKERRVERAVDTIRGRFGNRAIRRGVTLLSPELSAFDAENHTIHPVGYF